MIDSASDCCKILFRIIPKKDWGFLSGDVAWYFHPTCFIHIGHTQMVQWYPGNQVIRSDGLDTSVRLASVAEITSKKAPNNRNHHTELLPFHTYLLWFELRIYSLYIKHSISQTIVTRHRINFEVLVSAVRPKVFESLQFS